MIPIAEGIELQEDELQFTFIASPGPGGQNVNKVATAVQLRFNVFTSRAFPEPIRERLQKSLANKLTTQGDLIIKASRFRSQERNKQDAIDRLTHIIKSSIVQPKKRKKTKPTWHSIQQRLKHKKRHSAKKANRSKLD